MIYREMSISVNGSSIASDDAQKRKQIQQQLILIFHACRCQKHFEIHGVIPCSSPHCAMMRDVLTHMSLCNKDKQCPFSHCSTSKRILSHWKRCGKITCLICAPIKSKQQSNKNKITFDNTEHDGKSDNNSNNNNIVAINADNNNSLVVIQHDKKSFEYKSDVCDNKLKDWKTVDKNIRSRLINRIVETILPVKDCGKAYKDERMINIIDHAKKIENDSYLKSSTNDEYYRLLAENCFIIHKKLCISQKSSENCVNCPEIITKSPNISIDNSVNNNSDSEILFSTSNKACTDTDHLNHFEKILHNEYERQRKLLLNYDTIKEETKCELNIKELKSEPVVEPTKPIDTNNKPESLVKLWNKDELNVEFKVFFDFVKNNKNAQLFLSQVDCKNYSNMELSRANSKHLSLLIISQKLEDGSYNDPWSVVDDLNILIKNVYNYTKKKGKSKKDFVQSMSDIQILIDEIMIKLGFCCGRVEVYQPLTLLCCTANVCTINKDSVYYAYQNENDDKVPGMLVDSYLCCEKCYSDSASKVSFIAESNEMVTIRKDLLVKKRNNVEIHEEFVFCHDCKRKWHKVCACHIDEIWTSFYCKSCALNGHKRENKYTAKRLLPSVLSNFLEKRVNDYLKKNEITTDNVIIRVLSSVKKVTEVKPGMKTYFGDSDTSFPYRSKAIFAFQENQGREVCFFGLHVQEYGSDCPEPNRRRVYVAYLDSVKYFEPSKHRTKVYYEILVGYLDYVKKLGYVMAHIWACPPSEGDDYIFHIHPPDQRIPKPKRLQEWYTKMLDKGIQELVIDDYKDVYKDAHLSEIKSVNEIPYFEGDFWPNAFEDILKEFEENNRKAKESVQDEDDNDSVVNYEISKDNIGNKKPKKRKQKKTTNIATSKRKKIHDPADTVNELFKKVLEIMEKHKDNFFIIRLHPHKNVCNLKEINDPDPIVESELMDGRENFLQMARAKHLEFSNLRRSLYSTLVMCYELHNEIKQSFCYTCNACNAQIETRYHCNQCEEYDLCTKCYATEKHIHSLEKIRSGVEDENDNLNFKSEENCEETNRRRIDRLVKYFEHAATCRDACCRLNPCSVFKKALSHSKNCKERNAQSCDKCKGIFKLSAYHAKFCTDIKCTIIFCQQIKQKLKKQENKQRYIQKQILRRRTALMRCNSNVSNNPSSASGQEICNNTVTNSVAAQSQFQFVQNTGPSSNNSGSVNLEFTPVKTNNPPGSAGSFNMKSNYIQQSNQTVPIPINSHTNDNLNFQYNIYTNGNFPQINKGFPNPKDIQMVENIYTNCQNQPDGHLKFNEWLKNNPVYTPAYRHFLSSKQQTKPAIYSSNIPQNSIMHQRLSSAPSNQSQIPYYVNNSMPQQLNSNYIQDMNNHILGNKSISGIIPNQMSLPINRLSNHISNYSPSPGGPTFMMNNLNYIPNFQTHQSPNNPMRPASTYSQIPNGTNLNYPGSQQVFSKMIVPQKGLPPQQAQINFQSSNPNDSQIYRSNHQNNYF